MDERAQEARIREDLLAGKSITPLEALRDYGSMRLGARIHSLKRKRGMNIKTTMLSHVTPNGKKKRYASYSLES